MTPDIPTCVARHKLLFDNGGVYKGRTTWEKDVEKLCSDLLYIAQSGPQRLAGGIDVRQLQIMFYGIPAQRIALAIQDMARDEIQKALPTDADTAGALIARTDSLITATRLMVAASQLHRLQEKGEDCP